MSDITDQYYPGEAFTGYGSQLLVGQGGASPQTFVAIADVEVITPGEMSTNVIEKTHLRSPEAHREKLAGLRDSGAFALQGNWRPRHGSQSNAGGDGFTDGGLLYLWRTRKEADFKLVLADGSPGLELLMRGVVTKFQPGEISPDAKVGFTAEITPLQDFSAGLP